MSRLVHHDYRVDRRFFREGRYFFIADLTADVMNIDSPAESAVKDRNSMNICIIYETRFGNNSKIADRLMRTLGKLGHNAARHLVSESDPEVIPEADLYIIGSPTQIGTLPLRIDHFLRNLELLEGSRFAVFTTGVGSTSDAAEKIASILINRGGQEIAEPLRMGVKDLRGPLEEGWESKLSRWSDSLIP
jgi:flavodoxin